jgi:hypothetical protein
VISERKLGTFPIFLEKQGRVFSDGALTPWGMLSAGERSELEGVSQKTPEDIAVSHEVRRKMGGRNGKEVLEAFLWRQQRADEVADGRLCYDDRNWIWMRQEDLWAVHCRHSMSFKTFRTQLHRLVGLGLIRAVRWGVGRDTSLAYHVEIPCGALLPPAKKSYLSRAYRTRKGKTSPYPLPFQGMA